MRTGYCLRVSPVPITKDFGEQRCECWIVFFQLIAGIDMIMLIVICPIRVEPRLRPFSPVFCLVGNGIGVFPKPFFDCRLECHLKAVIKLGSTVLNPIW